MSTTPRFSSIHDRIGGRKPTNAAQRILSSDQKKERSKLLEQKLDDLKENAKAKAERKNRSYKPVDKGDIGWITQRRQENDYVHLAITNQDVNNQRIKRRKRRGELARLYKKRAATASAATPNPANSITASLPAKHAIDTNPQLPKVQDANQYMLQQLNKTATKFWKKRVPQLQLYAKDLKKITKTQFRRHDVSDAKEGNKKDDPVGLQ